MAKTKPYSEEEQAILAKYEQTPMFAPGEQPSLLSFPRIGNPSGKSLAFTLPDGEIAKTITGVIVAWTQMRTMWEQTYDDSDGGRPLCSSVGGVAGRGKPGGKCASCRHNEWNDDGSGKDCRESAWLIFLIDGAPHLVTVPTTSLKPWLNYRVALSTGAFSLSPQIVSTTIGIESAKNGAGKEYGKFTFSHAPLRGAALIDADRAAGRYSQLITSAQTSTPLLGNASPDASAPAIEDTGRVGESVGAAADTGAGDDLPFD